MELSATTMECVAHWRLTCLMSTALSLLTSLVCVASAVMAGVFFSFSALVMRALSQVDPAAAVTVMQSINVAAIRRVFLSVLLGTAVGAAGLVVAGLVSRSGAERTWLVAGGLAYLVGTIALTVGYHVPRNDALALVDPTTDDVADCWASFHLGWTRWNHVRTISSLASSTALLLALTTT